MHQLWQQRENFECTEQRVYDQKKQIEDKTLLTSAELEEVKAQVEEENIQEESTDQLVKKIILLVWRQ